MQNQGIIYNLLISPRYRVWRHVILIIAIILIVFNQLSIVYDFQIILIKQLLVYIIPVAISYLVIIYFNLYFLIPRYLLSKKYLHFIIGLVASILALNAIINIAEYIVYKVTNTPFNELSVFYENNLIADVVFSLFQLAICIMGVGTIVLLKEWMKENKNILQLEKEILQSEVEQLKERIAPETLFKILNNTAKRANDSVEEASAILVKLSHVLRYQLYDCSRDSVLLKSEIAFINNYLILLQMNFERPDYKLKIEGNGDVIFVPPLLFSSLLQVVIDKTDGYTVLDISFNIYETYILFICAGNNIESKDLEKIEQRLKFLYGDEYNIVLKNNQVELGIQI